MNAQQITEPATMPTQLPEEDSGTIRILRTVKQELQELEEAEAKFASEINSLQDKLTKLAKIRQEIAAVKGAAQALEKLPSNPPLVELAANEMLKETPKHPGWKNAGATAAIVDFLSDGEVKPTKDIFAHVKKVVGPHVTYGTVVALLATKVKNGSIRRFGAMGSRKFSLKKAVK